MIKINRRLVLIEAMNFCERRGWSYQLVWSASSLCFFEVTGGFHPEHEEELKKHLDRWEKED